ncbi:hypothetical protein HYFRA_00008794 [Hymenoscyphus fraxineus]|uniref:Uncharacterized protein n=1 Tax=Hymenoscyphus fraxineus TaxID=746836 RepID=A0A9N9PQM2_9HELO|nr:hypothetical protein HYFRA_00008794 [Hymenoscyphus fraxineus]
MTLIIHHPMDSKPAQEQPSSGMAPNSRESAPLYPTGPLQHSSSSAVSDATQQVPSCSSATLVGASTSIDSNPNNDVPLSRKKGHGMCCNPDLIKPCLEAEDKKSLMMPTAAIFEYMASSRKSTDPPPTAEEMERDREYFERRAWATSSQNDNRSQNELIRRPDLGEERIPEQIKMNQAHLDRIKPATEGDHEPSKVDNTSFDPRRFAASCRRQKDQTSNQNVDTEPACNALICQDTVSTPRTEEGKGSSRVRMEASLEGETKKLDKNLDTKKLDLRKYIFQPEESVDEDGDEEIPEILRLRGAVSRLNALARANNPERQNENVLICTLGRRPASADTTIKINQAALDRMYEDDYQRSVEMVGGNQKKYIGEPCVNKGEAMVIEQRPVGKSNKSDEIAKTKEIDLGLFAFEPEESDEEED